MTGTNELLNFVKDELHYFQFEWKDNISDAQIRRASASLRSLLHEGKLQLAWKTVGFEKQPKILAPNISGIAERLQLGKLKAFHAGGTSSNGQTLANFSIIEMSKPTDEDIDKLANEMNPEGSTKCVPMALGEFSKSVCLVIEATEFSRNEIVLYAANRMGGTHLDTKRDLSKELDRKFALLDMHRSYFKVTGRDPILYEIMNVVHYLERSKDMHKLRKTIEEKIGTR